MDNGSQPTHLRDANTVGAKTHGLRKRKNQQRCRSPRRRGFFWLLFFAAKEK